MTKLQFSLMRLSILILRLSSSIAETPTKTPNKEPKKSMYIYNTAIYNKELEEMQKWEARRNSATPVIGYSGYQGTDGNWYMRPTGFANIFKFLLPKK